jgi:hypothetical protein
VSRARNSLKIGGEPFKDLVCGLGPGERKPGVRDRDFRGWWPGLRGAASADRCHGGVAADPGQHPPRAGPPRAAAIPDRGLPRDPGCAATGCTGLGASPIGLGHAAPFPSRVFRVGQVRSLRRDRIGSPVARIGRAVLGGKMTVNGSFNHLCDRVETAVGSRYNFVIEL